MENNYRKRTNYCLSLLKKFQYSYNPFTNDPFQISQQDYHLSELNEIQATQILNKIEKESSHRDVEDDYYYQQQYNNRLYEINNAYLQKMLNRNNEDQNTNNKNNQNRDSQVKNVAMTFLSQILVQEDLEQAMMYIITGPPNIGKSCYLKQLVLKFCDRILSSRQSLIQNDYNLDEKTPKSQIGTPFYIDCRSLINIHSNQSIKSNIQSKGLIRYMIDQQESQFQQMLKEEYENKNLVVFTDGIDQIGQFKFQIMSILKEMVLANKIKSIVIGIRNQLLSQITDIQKQCKIYQMIIPNISILRSNIRKQIGANQFEIFNQMCDEFKLWSLMTDFHSIQIILLLYKSKQLTFESFKNEKYQLNPKIKLIWSKIKHITKLQIQNNKDFTKLINQDFPAIAFDLLERNLKDFSEVDFHNLSGFYQWKGFLLQIGRPQLKDNQRLIFYLSEQICTFLDAMNSFIVGSTIDMNRTNQILLKNVSNKYLLKNKQLLKETIREGKPYMINDFLNNSEISYMTESSNEESNLPNQNIRLELENRLLNDRLDDDFVDTKFPTPTKNIDNQPTPSDLLNKNPWLYDDNRQNVMIKSFILDGKSFKDNISRNAGLQMVESCLIEENEEDVSNKPIFENNKMHGIAEINIKNVIQDFHKNDQPQRIQENGQNYNTKVLNYDQTYSKPKQSIIHPKYSIGLHQRDESTATLLMEKSPLSTQRSKINLNALMDAYNNLNKHPSVLAFNSRKDGKVLQQAQTQYGNLINKQNNVYDNTQQVYTMQQQNYIKNEGDQNILKLCESSLSINPYMQGTIDIENDESNINRFVDIFRFSSVNLHHYLAAEYIFQAIEKSLQATKNKKIAQIDYKTILYQEQFQKTLKYLPKLLIYRSIKHKKDYLYEYLQQVIQIKPESIFTLNQLYQKIDKYLKIIQQKNTIFKKSISTQDQIVKIKMGQITNENIINQLFMNSSSFTQKIFLEEYNKFVDIQKIQTIIQKQILKKMIEIQNSKYNNNLLLNQLLENILILQQDFPVLQDIFNYDFFKILLKLLLSTLVFEQQQSFQQLNNISYINNIIIILKQILPLSNLYLKGKPGNKQIFEFIQHNNEHIMTESNQQDYSQLSLPSNKSSIIQQSLSPHKFINSNDRFSMNSQSSNQKVSINSANKDQLNIKRSGIQLFKQYPEVKKISLQSSNSKDSQILKNNSISQTQQIKNNNLSTNQSIINNSQQQRSLSSSTQNSNSLFNKKTYRQNNHQDNNNQKSLSNQESLNSTIQQMKNLHTVRADSTNSNNSVMGGGLSQLFSPNHVNSSLKSPSKRNFDNSKINEQKWKELLQKEKKLIEEIAIKLIQQVIDVDITLIVLQDQQQQIILNYIDILLMLGCSQNVIQNIIAQKYQKTYKQQSNILILFIFLFIDLSESHKQLTCSILQSILEKFVYISEEAFITLIQTHIDIQQIKLLKNINLIKLNNYALQELQIQGQDAEQICNMLKILQITYYKNQQNNDKQILKLLSFFIDDSNQQVQMSALRSLNFILEILVNQQNLRNIHQMQECLAAVPFVIKDRLQLFINSNVSFGYYNQKEFISIIIEQIKCLVYLHLLFDNKDNQVHDVKQLQNIVVDQDYNNYFVGDTNQILQQFVYLSYNKIIQISDQKPLKASKQLYNSLIIKLFKNIKKDNLNIQGSLIQDTINYLILNSSDINPQNIDNNLSILTIISFISEKIEDQQQIQVIEMIIWKCLICIQDQQQIIDLITNILILNTQLQDRILNIITQYIESRNSQQIYSKFAFYVNFNNMLKYLNQKLIEIELEISVIQSQQSDITSSYRQSINIEDNIKTQDIINQNVMNQKVVILQSQSKQEDKIKRKIPQINQSLKKNQLNMNKLVEKQNKNLSAQKPVQVSKFSGPNLSNLSQVKMIQVQKKQSNKNVMQQNTSTQIKQQPHIISFQIQNINQSLNQTIELQSLNQKFSNVKTFSMSIEKVIQLIKIKQDTQTSPMIYKQTYQSIFSSPDKEQQMILSLEQPSLVPQFRSLLVSPTQKQMPRNSNVDNQGNSQNQQPRKFFLTKGKHFKQRSGSSSNIRNKMSDHSKVENTGNLLQQKLQEFDFRDSDKLKSPQPHLKNSYQRLQGQLNQNITEQKYQRKADNSGSRVQSEQQRFFIQSEPRKHKIFLKNLQKYIDFEAKEQQSRIPKSPSRLIEGQANQTYISNNQFNTQRDIQKSPFTKRVQQQILQQNIQNLSTRRSRERTDINQQNSSRIEKLNQARIQVLNDDNYQLSQKKSVYTINLQNIIENSNQKTDLSRSIVDRSKAEEIKSNVVKKVYKNDQRQKVYTTFQKRDMSFEVPYTARGKAESQYVEQNKYLNTQEESIPLKGDDSNNLFFANYRTGTQYTTEFSALKYQSKIMQIQQISRTKKVNQLSQSKFKNTNNDKLLDFNGRGFVSHENYTTGLQEQKIFDSPIKDELESDYNTQQLVPNRGNSNLFNQKIDQQILKKMEIYDSLYNPPKLTRQLLSILKLNDLDQKLVRFIVEQFVQFKVKDVNRIEEIQVIVQQLLLHDELFFLHKRQIIEKLQKMLNAKSKNVVLIIKELDQLNSITNAQGLNYFELIIDNAMMEEISLEKFQEIKVLFVELCVELISRFFNHNPMEIEDEDLIKILYKLEIMINYDAPNNNLKSQMIRYLGEEILKYLTQKQLNIYKSGDQIKLVLSHFVFSEKLQNYNQQCHAAIVTPVQCFCLDGIISYFVSQKKINIFYIIPQDLFSCFFQDNIRNNSNKQQIKDILQNVLQIGKQMNILSNNQLQYCFK